MCAEQRSTCLRRSIHSGIFLLCGNFDVTLQRVLIRNESSQFVYGTKHRRNEASQFVYSVCSDLEISNFKCVIHTFVPAICNESARILHGSARILFTCNTFRDHRLQTGGDAARDKARRAPDKARRAP